MLPTWMRKVCAASFLALAGALQALPASAQEPPLPDPRAFLDDVRKNLESDDTLLEQYTFTESLIEKRLDAKGAVKKTRHDVYEVYPSLEPGQMYRRLIVRDGRTLSDEELAEQDRKHEVKAAKRKAAAEDEATRKKRAEARRKEQEVVDEVFRMDEILIEGREKLNGRPTIVLSFTPRPGFRPVSDGARVIQKVAGRAWIDEEDRELVKLEVRLLENLGVGPARIARLQKGAVGYFERRKVNGEIWLPTEARFSGAAKVLFFFGTHLDIQSLYTDYKKFSVGTDEEIRAEPAGSAARNATPD